MRTARTECLDHRLVMGHQHLQRLIDEYVDYYNEWRPHRSSINQLHVDAREGGLARRLD